MSVVLAAVLDETVGVIKHPDLLVGEGVNEGVVEALLAFGFDGGSAVGIRLLHEGDDVGLGLVLITLGIFCGGRLLTDDRVDEEIVGAGDVEQLLGAWERTLSPDR